MSEGCSNPFHDHSDGKQDVIGIRVGAGPNGEPVVLVHDLLELLEHMAVTATKSMLHGNPIGMGSLPGIQHLTELLTGAKDAVSHHMQVEHEADTQIGSLPDNWDSELLEKLVAEAGPQEPQFTPPEPGSEPTPEPDEPGTADLLEQMMAQQAESVEVTDTPDPADMPEPESDFAAFLESLASGPPSPDTDEDESE